MSVSRFISRLTRDTYALVLAGGRGSRLHELTEWRAKPAVYFGGKYRIIDFPLSNCVNSGIRRIGVITQYKSHSLIQHLMRGWGHFKRELGESVAILPASQRYSDNWYRGTADAVFQNIDIIRGEVPKYVMILSGDHIYRQDYGSMLGHHVETGADMTVSCMEVPVAEASGAYGVMTVDSDFVVRAFDEKPVHPEEVPGKPGYAMASMGNYVFNTDFLFDHLRRDQDDESSEHDFGRNVIPSLIEHDKVVAYPFRDETTSGRAYWRDVGTLDSFWRANMELVGHEPLLNLYDAHWPIWTYPQQLPPAKFVWDDDERRGTALDSMVSSGCIISGAKIRKSVLFYNVRANSFAELNESVVLPDVDVGRHCRIRRSIIDRGCAIPEGSVIGFNADDDRAAGFPRNRQRIGAGDTKSARPAGR